jgi:16S rRNA (cytidine1402-2'-O)-methyltransferase
MSMAGKLYLVATPIGNLGDISERALATLAGVDLIACEDTRTSGRLLKHFGIRKPLVSYHNFNERRVADRIVSRLQAGENVAVVSDAGTPAISDPGFIVVREAVRNDIEIVAIPGASAAIAALAVSGLPTDAFMFHGFLPVKAGKRRAVLESVADRRETLIFYESPHRVVKFLSEALSVLGNRQAVLCRELTKKFEEILRGELVSLIERLKDRKIKGEVTIVVAGKLRNELGEHTSAEQ